MISPSWGRGANEQPPGRCGRAGLTLRVSVESRSSERNEESEDGHNKRSHF